MGTKLNAADKPNNTVSTTKKLLLSVVSISGLRVTATKVLEDGSIVTSSDPNASVATSVLKRNVKNARL